jgi:TonB family protein
MGSTPANSQDPSSQRRGLRYSLEAPLDVTVLRWGIPDTVPGRSLNLGAGGFAAVLASELSPGDKVGVEIRLPELEKPLRARALVRHHDKLRCGMEFIGLSPEQQAEIQRWAAKAKPEPGRAAVKKPAGAKPAGTKAAEKSGSGKSTPPPPPPKLRGNGWIFLALSAVILIAVLWWRWNRGWEELESALHRDDAMPQAQVQVPAEAMEKLIRHRVDPDYPPAARPQKLQGVIVLDVVVGRDGSVAGVRALGGPEILAQAAEDALRWWRFEPYRVDGQPVVAETTVAVEFKP